MKDPRFDRLLHITIGAGIVVFGFAESQMALTALALLVWAGAWFVSVGPGGGPLPRAAIGLLVLGATAYTLLSVISAGPSELVGGVARYLLFLQLIKLFDRIGPRDRGQLLAMSIALVIGACLMSNRLLLGAGLLFYVPLVMLTAASLQMHLGRMRAVEARRSSGLGDSTPHRASVAGSTLRRMIIGSGIVVVAIMSASFILLPRGLDPDIYGDLFTPRRGEVGFDDEVRLGAAGLLTESDDPVLEIRITTPDGESAGTRIGRMYLRGAVLDHYQDGSWTHRDRSGDHRPQVLESGQQWEFDAAEDGGKTFVQHIELKNKTKPQLFSLYRPVAITMDRIAQVRQNQHTQTLTTDVTGRLSYTIVADAMSPVVGQRRNRRQPRIFGDGAVHDEAIQVIGDAGMLRDESQQHTADDTRIARAIELHLWSRCEYTTEMVAPDSGEDPIEMFLFRTRRGHCEYFASAMAAMLRSVGMDARVVTGYVVEEERVTSNSFVVRESDAHAWVEAHVAPGIWRVFDPSPPEDIEALHATGGGLGRVLRDLQEGLQDLWARSVIGYSRDKQISMVGDWAAPMEGRLREFIQDGGGDGLRAAPLRAAASAALAGIVVFSVFAGSAFGLRWMVGALAVRLGMFRRRRKEARGDRELRQRLVRVSFFFEAMNRLRRAGLAPPEWRSPLEHARSLEQVDAPMSEAVTRIASLYYEARYGGRMLSDADVEAGRTALDTVATRLRDVRANRNGKRRA